MILEFYRDNLPQKQKDLNLMELIDFSLVALSINNAPDESNFTEDGPPAVLSYLMYEYVQIVLWPVEIYPQRRDNEANLYAYTQYPSS